MAKNGRAENFVVGWRRPGVGQLNERGDAPGTTSGVTGLLLFPCFSQLNTLAAWLCFLQITGDGRQSSRVPLIASDVEQEAAAAMRACVDLAHWHFSIQFPASYR